MDTEGCLNLLRELDAYYKCVKNKDGKRLTPLVGYVGRYKGREGEELQYVGDEYFNMRKVESNSEILYRFADMLEKELARVSFEKHIYHRVDDIGVICGAPEGGRKLSLAFADIQRRRD